MERKAITIIGLSGSGKSTIGELLAEALGWPFTDTDKEIERETGMSVPEIFDKLGERTFREIERKVVLRSIDRGGVISLGGGAILDPESREAILSKSLSFYIRVSIDELERRLRVCAQDRPLLRGNLRERLMNLYEARKELYEMAHHIIDGDGLSPREICALMAMRLNGAFEEIELHSSLHSAQIGKVKWEGIRDFPLITTRKVRDIYGVLIENERVEVLPDGEEAKDIKVVERLYRRLIDWGVERKDCIVSFGGGALSDAVGFVSATFKRGCDFVSVPTTLLAQVDASIGGKTAINLGEIKNVIGAFKVPKIVLIDPVFTLSQEPRDYNEGLVEAIKIALVASPPLFSFIEEKLDQIRRRNLKTLIEVIRMAIELKLSIASKDLFDKGIRHILNFGHTLGHAIESAYGLKHGEAVSLGMVFALKLGERLGISRKGVSERVVKMLESLSMPTELRSIDLGEIGVKMAQDKKIRGGKVNFVLVKDIGEPIIAPMDLSQLSSYLAELPLRKEPRGLISVAYPEGEVFQEWR